MNFTPETIQLLTYASPFIVVSGFAWVTSVLAKKSEQLDEEAFREVSTEPLFTIQEIPTYTNPVSADFSQAYPTAEAERGKFAVANIEDSTFTGYPSSGNGKFVMLTYDVNEFNAVDFSQSYPVAEAERGKFVKLDLDPSTGYPVDGRGRYAVLTYNCNNYDSRYLRLSGGTMLGDIDMGGNDILNANEINATSINAISSTITYVDIVQYELSGFHSTGDVFIDGLVGIGTHEPNKELTVVGNISSTSTVYASALQLDTSVPENGTNPGSIYWNTVEETMNIGLNNDVVLQVGEEQLIKIKAAENILNGQAVYASDVDGNGSGNLKGSLYSSLSSFETQPGSGVNDNKFFIGIATQDIAQNDTGYITTFGKVRDVLVANTRGSDDPDFALPNNQGWDIGTVLYVSSDAGKYTSSRPIAPNKDLPVAIVISENGNQRTLFVRATSGFTLSELHDVYVNGVQDKELLVYNDVLSRWETTSDIEVNSISTTDTPYSSSWNSDSTVPTKNAVYDKVESLGSIMVIFAEESLTGTDTSIDNGYQWSFGNGDNTPSGHGIPLPYDCELIALSLNIEGRTATGTVEVEKSGTLTGASITLSSGTSTTTTLASPVSFSAGDVLNFKSTATSGGDSSRVAAFIRVKLNV